MSQISGIQGPPGPMGPAGPAGVPSKVIAGAGLVSAASGWQGSTLEVNYDQIIPEILRRLGLQPGDKLLVKSFDGKEREVRLACLDMDAAREVVDE